MYRTIFSCSILLLGAVGQHSVCLAASEGILTVDPGNATPRVRSNAPVSVHWKVHWHGSSILEGHFEIAYLANQRMVAKNISHDLVLTPGEQTVRLGLPTAGSLMAWGQDQVAVTFVTQNQTYDLGRYPLIGRSVGRSLSVCICGSRERMLGAIQDELLKPLRFGLLLNEKQSPVKTANTHWRHDDMPTSPLQYCNFDIVVLTGESLLDLRKRQLKALLDWTRAGGSVCVLLGNQLETRHLDFLHELLEDTDDPPFFLDSNGQLVIDPQDPSRGIWQSQTGLGRSAIVHLESVAKRPDLQRTSREISCFLWKVRESKVATLVKSEPGTDLPQQRGTFRGNAWNAWQTDTATGQFVERLMPSEVRVMPASLIGLMLFGYLLVIGPLDYFVLGYFKIRRFTWLTFPIATLAAAVLCVKISEGFLSSDNTGNTLTVRDVDREGNVLRENRFQLLFIGSRRVVTSEVRNEVFTPLDSQRLMLNDRYAYRYQYGMRNPTDQKPDQYVGLVPANYQVRQTIAQWHPQVNRYFAIAPSARVDFDWNQEKRLKTIAGRKELRRQILDKWPNASALALNGPDHYVICGKPVFNNDYARRNRWRHPTQLEQADQFLFDLCRMRGQDFFEVVYQLSPNGGDNFEDLALLDETNLSAWLLVISVPDGNNLTIYRRLFTESD